MSHGSSNDRASRLLCDLISLPTVNPMGRPYPDETPVERPVIEYLERLFSQLGVGMERQACGPFHESLLITISGRTAGPGTLLESHMDTVPADDWLERAFRPRCEGDMVYGRGACDDKGSLAAMVLALLDILESGESPPQTVWLLAAGDEEYAQTGIKKFVAQHSAPIGRGIFGEPTDCVPVVQHKGAIRWDISVHGRSAHTSQPEVGRNAILEMMRVIAYLAKYQEELRQRYTNPWMSGPTLTVTMIHGGRTRNAVPDECSIAVDFRILPGMDRQQAIDELFAGLQQLGISITHSDFQCFAPALSTPPDDRFVQTVLATCRTELGRSIDLTAAPYCSDACWIPAGVPAVVLGPGDIAKAHAVDECVSLDQVVQCAAIYRQLALQDWSRE